MSYYQDDGKRPVYRKPAGAGSNWTFLLPVEVFALLAALVARVVNR